MVFARVFISNFRHPRCLHRVTRNRTFTCTPDTSLPSGMKTTVINPIIEMTISIAADPGNQVLDPPRFYCDSGRCQFCRSDINAQLYVCLKRVHQLCSQLNMTNNDNHYGETTF